MKLLPCARFLFRIWIVLFNKTDENSDGEYAYWHNVQQDKIVPNLSSKISPHPLHLIEVHISEWKEEKRMTMKILL